MRYVVAYPAASGFTSAWISDTDLLTIGPEFLVTEVGRGERRRFRAAQSNTYQDTVLPDGAFTGTPQDALEAQRLPTFRRIRYDVNVESLATGHYYGVFFDRCHLTAQPTVVMCQCEIEYCRSRTTQRADARLRSGQIQF